MKPISVIASRISCGEMRAASYVISPRSDNKAIRDVMRPGRVLRAYSMEATHEAHVMPLIEIERGTGDGGMMAFGESENDVMATKGIATEVYGDDGKDDEFGAASSRAAFAFCGSLGNRGNCFGPTTDSASVFPNISGDT